MSACHPVVGVLASGATSRSAGHAPSALAADLQMQKYAFSSKQASTKNILAGWRQDIIAKPDANRSGQADHLRAFAERAIPAPVQTGAGVVAIQP